jgi:hypothetical protein
MSGRRALRLLRRLGSAASLLAAALPALAANPELGPNVLIFDPSMPSQAIQKQIDAVSVTQQHNELGPQRNAPCPETIRWTCRWASTRRGLDASPDATRIARNLVVHRVNRKITLSRQKCPITRSIKAKWRVLTQCFSKLA